MENRHELPTCAVTQHLVNVIADDNPELFKPNGVQNDYAVLFYLGFDVKASLRNKKFLHEKDGDEKVCVGFEVHNVEHRYNSLIRSTEYPQAAYHTAIYKGFLRKKAMPDGSLHPTQYHHMYDVYNEFEVLQPDNLFDFIEPSALVEIQTIQKGK
ncbi:hypothetical protein NVP1121O_184 [Vibrio phage 1.121.O._10N.286.46.C4]|nr:hypothetical protein NVP1121O_184 [Vibrio phage 1.121.O._10N.286.46.C4]